MVFNDWDSLAETRSGLAPEGVVQNPALKLVIRMRKVIETSKFLMYVERSTSKAFGCDIVSRNRENEFLSDFREGSDFRGLGRFGRGSGRFVWPAEIEPAESPKPCFLLISNGFNAF